MDLFGSHRQANLDSMCKQVKDAKHKLIDQFLSIFWFLPKYAQKACVVEETPSNLAHGSEAMTLGSQSRITLNLAFLPQARQGSPRD